MSQSHFLSGISRRALVSTLATLPALAGLGLSAAQAQLPAGSAPQGPLPADPLPSWNDGPAKQAIVDFVRATTDTASPQFVPPEERIATFDQDGTLWVEHPIYTQVMYCLDRVPALVKAKPELQERRAVQDRAVRRPRGHREAARCELGRNRSSPRSPA